MSNVYTAFEQRVRKAVQAVVNEGNSSVDLSRVTVETPRDPSHGDLATNAAMVLAKPLGQKPRDLAEQLCAELAKEPDVSEVQVAGPGFINLRLHPFFWRSNLSDITANPNAFGRTGLGEGLKVNVEYVSANPTGPMHVGHCRGAVVGDALANLLDFAGFDVTREYYTNDAGGQIDVLARSVFLRYREALGEEIGTIPEGLYPGDYLVRVGEALANAHGDALTKMSEDEWLAIVKPFSINAMMDLIREDLNALGVRHDVFFSERTLHEPDQSGGESRVARAIADLQSKGFVYHGTLPPPKGQVPEDWEDREQLLFRSTDVGDDMDRPLAKSNGDYTYFASDVAYFLDKFERGFKETVFILGADHSGYVKRLQAVARAVSQDTVKLTVRLCQLVKLFRDGEPVKMSKRSGDFITLREVVDEVGRDAVRFMMLYRKNDAPLDFDFAKVTEQSKDNPVFYVQYAHARCKSIFRQAAQEVPDLPVSGDDLASVALDRLTDEGELSLIKMLARFPRTIEGAATSHEPHRVAFYLYELASLLHAQWSRGKDRPELRFINHDQPELTQARLALVLAVSAVLASGLGVIGAGAPDEMR
ncbi:MAG: arginine--tRNA ligase [Pseudomonadota bacterium]